MMKDVNGAVTRLGFPWGNLADVFHAMLIRSPIQTTVLKGSRCQCTTQGNRSCEYFSKTNAFLEQECETHCWPCRLQVFYWQWKYWFPNPPPQASYRSCHCRSLNFNRRILDLLILSSLHSYHIHHYTFCMITWRVITLKHIRKVTYVSTHTLNSILKQGHSGSMTIPTVYVHYYTVFTYTWVTWQYTYRIFYQSPGHIQCRICYTCITLLIVDICK